MLFAEEEVKASSSVKQLLSEISHVDIQLIMDSIENALKDEFIIHYSDEQSIHLKVDRRKNILKIKEDIEALLHQLVIDVLGIQYSGMIFKVKTGNNMVIIKRRR